MTVNRQWNKQTVIRRATAKEMAAAKPLTSWWQHAPREGWQQTVDAETPRMQRGARVYSWESK